MTKAPDDNDRAREGGFDPEANVIPFPDAPENESQPPPPPEPTNEDGEFYTGSDVELGQRLILDVRNGGSVDPVYDRGGLHRYDELGGVWEKLDEALLRRMLHRYDNAALAKDRETLSLSHAKIRGAVNCAFDSVSQRAFFDNAPPGIVFANGSVRVTRDGAYLEPNNPENRTTARLSFEYDPKAPAKRWSRFLDDVWLGAYDLGERKRLLRQFIGGALVGEAAKHTTALCLYGPGANGKSVIMSAIRKLFPKEVIASVPPHDMKVDYCRATLAGARINLASEIASDEIVDSTSFKALIEPLDLVKARNPYERVFTFVPTAAHVFSCNTLPGTRDFTKGFFRRWLILKFERTFEGKDADPNLSAALETELPGIAAWAIEGAIDLLQNGRFAVPRSSEAAVEEWREDVDQVARFVKEECIPLPIPVDSKQRSAECRGSRDLYKEYQRWANDTGHGKMSETSFGKRMVTLGYPRGEDARGRFFWLDLKPIAPKGGK